MSGAVIHFFWRPFLGGGSPAVGSVPSRCRISAILPSAFGLHVLQADQRSLEQQGIFALKWHRAQYSAVSCNHLFLLLALSSWYSCRYRINRGGIS